jgi:hypothetical protein
MENKTSITVTKKTLCLLHKLKKHKREALNDVVARACANSKSNLLEDKGSNNIVGSAALPTIKKKR